MGGSYPIEKRASRLPLVSYFYCEDGRTGVNFFKLYIGDYQRDTGALTLAEHGAYMLMLQHFYATERPLPTGKELHRLLRAESAAERKAINSVSSMFWTTTDEGLVNKRSMRELERDAHNRDMNAINGRKGGRPIKTDSVMNIKSEEVMNIKTDPLMNIKSESKPSIAITKPQKTFSPPIVPPLSVDRSMSAFDRFWVAYPRRVGKEAARRIFERLKPDETLLAVMLSAIKKQASSAQWQGDGGKFIPHPATWLNQGRWQDEEGPAEVDSNRPKWALDAGFANRWEAQNAGCRESNAHRFQAGKQVEVSA